MSVASQFDIVRSFLRELPPAGRAGFEGLIAACFAHLTGRIFRLARSGSQFGHDGRAEPDGEPAVLFECKRYDDTTSLNLRELDGEILQAASQFGPDLLWVLATPIVVDANAVLRLVTTGDQAGIETLIIDALPDHMPRLAVLLAAGRPAVEAWWDAVKRADAIRRTRAPAEIGGALAALAAIAREAGFAEGVDQLRARLSAADRSFAATRARLDGYHRRTFADRARSREAFGQSIAPLDPAVRRVPRPAVVAKLDAVVAAGRTVFVLGEEGVGKSWLVADWWLRHGAERPLVFLSAREAAAFAESGAGEAVLAAAILRIREPTGADDDGRLRRLIALWRTQPQRCGPIIVLDGLNERQVAWDGLLMSLDALARELGGLLVVTCRPGYYEREGFSRLDFDKREVTIGGYAPDELAAALALHGRDLASVPARVRPGLANPRVFTLAIGLLDELGADELTVDRLLFGYWQHRLADRHDLRHRPQDFHNLLVSHAREIRAGTGGASHTFDLNRWKEHSSLARRGGSGTLDHDLDEIAEGRFMLRRPHPTRESYAFRDEHLPFALGMRLAFEVLEGLWDGAATATELLARAIEPIAGFDRSFEVLQGTLAVACLHRPDPRSLALASDLASAVIAAMMDFRNRVEAVRSEFVAFVREDPAVYLDAAEQQTERDPHEIDEWLLDALRFGRRARTRPRDRSAAETIDTRLAQWLAWLPPDFSVEGAGTAERDLLAAQVSPSFSPRRHPRQLACRILAGFALRPFVPSILAGLILAPAVVRSAAFREIAWLLVLNQADPRAVETAVAETAQSWVRSGVSPAGRAALATMLRAIGSGAAVRLAADISGDAAGGDPRAFFGPDHLRERKAEPERLVDDLAGTVTTALARDDGATLGNVATLYPSFPHLLDTTTLHCLAERLGAVPRGANVPSDPAETDAAGRIAQALGAAAMQTPPIRGRRRVEPFALLQSLLAATADPDMPALLERIDLPDAYDAWPTVEEDCTLPLPDSVEAILALPGFADDPRTAGLFRLLRRGPAFRPGPRLREAIARIGSRATTVELGDAALDLAAHLPDDPDLDLDRITPPGRMPGRSFADSALFARASCRLGLDAVDERLGPGGRCLAIASVPTGDLMHLLDRLAADLDRIVRRDGTVAAGSRMVERQIEALHPAAADRLAAEVPAWLETWASRLVGALAGGDLPSSLEPFALSLLPPLSKTAPVRAASLLDALLCQRFDRSRPRPLSSSGLAHALAMAEHPETDAVIARLIFSSTDDGMLAEITGLAAAVGPPGRVARLVLRWIEADRPATVAIAVALGVGLSRVPVPVTDRLVGSDRGFVGAVIASCRQRLETRRRAEAALARRESASDVAERLRLEAVAIHHATPGEPLDGCLRLEAGGPSDRLLALRLRTVAEQRCREIYAKTLCGLAAPPAWMTACCAAAPDT